MATKCALVEPDHPQFSVRRQCELLGLNRATYYYSPATESALNLELMRGIDEQYLTAGDGKTGSKIDCCRGLADPAFLIGDGYDSSHCCCWRPVGGARSVPQSVASEIHHGRPRLQPPDASAP